MQAENDYDVNLKELLEILWQFRWTLVLTTFGCVGLACAVAYFQVPKYQATVLVVVQSGSSGGGLGGLTSQLGGLASLAGISMSSGDNARSESIAVLQSEALTETYIQRNNLLPALFPESWDSATKRWKEIGGKRKPSLWMANELFSRKIRSVVEDKKTGLVKIGVTWTDPKVAAAWANELVGLANSYLRERAIAESERHIKYLTEQAMKTDVAQLKAAIYSVLESEIKNIMLARGTDEYSFKIIDPAVPPEKRSSPKLLVFIGAGAVAGLLLSVIIITIRKAFAS